MNLYYKAKQTKKKNRQKYYQPSYIYHKCNAESHKGSTKKVNYLRRRSSLLVFLLISLRICDTDPF